MGTKLAAKAAEHLISQINKYINLKIGENCANGAETVTLLGLRVCMFYIISSK